jgi:hypothetical protein
MKYTDKIQNLLPLGYLFLVIMGILKEGIFYYQIGINILSYSSILDILISPISTITSHYIMLIYIILIFILCYYLPSYLEKNNHKKSVQKLFELKTTTELSIEESKNYYIFIAVKFLAAMLLSSFVGFGFYGGLSTSKKIREGKLDYNYKLNYTSGETEIINVIGSNSSYYFYVAKGNKNIKIAPVATIKNLELINNKMLK